ncbi:MAG: type 1 glutamine amidotransferase domain-containing protein [Cyclobacteriaceae bacterium]
MKNYFLISISLLLVCICVSCNHSATKFNGKKILFIASNAHYYGNSNISASNHFAEIVHAYDVLIQAGHLVDFVSPEGGAIPIGYIDTADTIMKQYLYDSDFMQLLKFTKKPSDVKAEDYSAVYYSGGGSAMFGVSDSEPIQKIVMEVYEEQNGIISALCHGTAGIVNLKTKDQKYLVDGKKVNGFPDLFENQDAEYYKQFPFSIQNVIEERGGSFKFSSEGWDGYVEADGRLITGQDPSAAAPLARHLISLIENIESQ